MFTGEAGNLYCLSSSILSASFYSSSIVVDMSLFLLLINIEFEPNPLEFAAAYGSTTDVEFVFFDGIANRADDF